MAKTLLVGYKAADLTPALLAGDVTCHTLDVYHRHAIEKVHHAKAICSPHLPDGPWDVVRFRTGPKLMSGELALDLLQECAKLVGHDLKPPRFVLDYVGRERDRNDLLDKVRRDAARERSFKAEWPASVPGGPKLLFTSYPGCFCHRRLDEGGLALAEVVSRELLAANPPKEPKVQTPKRPNPQTLHLLDMGGGCGLVGLLVATAISDTRDERGERGERNLAAPSSPHSAIRPVDPSPTHSIIRPFDHSIISSLVLVDSHARAVEAAKENAAKFGVSAEVILSDNGTPARMDGTFDVFVGNPPYYSDYRIAEVFLETAVRALKPGGVCYQVVKNAAGLEPVQRRYFPDVEVIRRRNYCVLKSVKPS